MEALRAVERQLRQTPDPAVLGFRTELLDGLTEEEYANAAAGGPLPDFPYAYAEEVGLPLLERARRRRARGVLVRIAAHGQPERGPGLFQNLAQVAEKNGDPAEAHKAPPARPRVRPGRRLRRTWRPTRRQSTSPP